MGTESAAKWQNEETSSGEPHLQRVLHNIFHFQSNLVNSSKSPNLETQGFLEEHRVSNPTLRFSSVLMLRVCMYVYIYTW